MRSNRPGGVHSQSLLARVDFLDEQLVERCICNDGEAWRALIARYRPMVLRVLIRATNRRDRALILDLEQDLWARLLANERAVLRPLAGKPPAALKALLSVMALNLGRDHGRKTAVREAVLPEQLAGLAGCEGKGPEEAANVAERCRLVLEAAARLVTPAEAARDLLIFRAYYQDERTSKEIAAMGVGLSVKGVEAVIQRLTVRVRAHFAGATEDA